MQGIQQSAQEWRLKEGVAFLVHGGDYAVRGEEGRCAGGPIMGCRNLPWHDGRKAGKHHVFMWMTMF